MALCDLHWYSRILAKHVGTYVYVPDETNAPFATFYLLHGLSDDYTIWLRRTSIERYAAQHSMMIVMPDGFRGFYTDNADGPEYAKYIGEELPAMIERTFPARPRRQSRAIGGLSMGGYGALRIALGYPQTFASANSHSGAVMHGSRNHPRVGGSLENPEFLRIFGREPVGTDHDVIALAKRAKSSGAEMPKIRIDCGTEDDLLADNRRCHDELTRLGIAHEYEEFPGGHNWEYWDVHVRDALAFHARNLGLV